MLSTMTMMAMMTAITNGMISQPLAPCTSFTRLDLFRFVAVLRATFSLRGVVLAMRFFVIMFVWKKEISSLYLFRGLLSSVNVSKGYTFRISHNLTRVLVPFVYFI